MTGLPDEININDVRVDGAPTEVSTITLEENDQATLTHILRQTFEPRLSGMVNSNYQ